MTTNVLVTFYSTYGHVHRMALARVQLRRIAELEEARKALSAQDAYVRAQQAQADIMWSRMTICAGPTAVCNSSRACGALHGSLLKLAANGSGIGLIDGLK